MICDECKVAGDFNSLGNDSKAEELHSQCKGDCPCLHKIGAGWFVKRGAKAPVMRTQSP